MKVTVYSSEDCVDCEAAKALLREKGASIDEIIMTRVDVMPEFGRHNDWRSFPQVFIGMTHVGDLDSLQALESNDALGKFLDHS